MDLLNIKLKATERKARFLQDSIGEEKLTVGDLKNKLTLSKAKTRAAEGRFKGWRAKLSLTSRRSPKQLIKLVLRNAKL